MADDELHGGAGGDTLDGGADTFIISNLNDGDVISDFRQTASGATEPDNDKITITATLDGQAITTVYWGKAMMAWTPISMLMNGVRRRWRC